MMFMIASFLSGFGEVGPPLLFNRSYNIAVRAGPIFGMLINRSLHTGLVFGVTLLDPAWRCCQGNRLHLAGKVNGGKGGADVGS